VDLAGATNGLCTAVCRELNSVRTEVGEAEGDLPCWYAEGVTDFFKAAAGDDCSYDFFGFGRRLEGSGKTLLQMGRTF